jgi:hypothetical protein
VIEKLKALKEFPYRGVPVLAGAEFEPENDDQARLLIHVGLAEPVEPTLVRGRRNSYRRRDMTAEDSRES